MIMGEVRRVSPAEGQRRREKRAGRRIQDERDDDADDTRDLPMPAAGNDCDGVYGPRQAIPG